MRVKLAHLDEGYNQPIKIKVHIEICVSVFGHAWTADFLNSCPLRPREVLYIPHGGERKGIHIISPLTPEWECTGSIEDNETVTFSW